MVVAADVNRQSGRAPRHRHAPPNVQGRRNPSSFCRRTPPRPSQAGVLPQAQFRGCLDGRFHQHAERVHGLVPGQEDQNGVRHEHHGPSTRARSCGMIGGDGINDESNKMAPAPAEHLYLITYTRGDGERRSRFPWPRSRSASRRSRTGRYRAIGRVT